MSDWERVPAPSDEAAPPRWASVLPKLLGATYVLVGFPFIFFILRFLRRARHLDWTSAFDLFLNLMVLIVMPLLVITGVGLLTNRPWSRPMAVVGPLIATIGGLALIVDKMMIGAVFVWLFISIPTLFIWFLMSRPMIAQVMTGEPQPDDNFLRSLLIAFASVAVAVGFVGLIIYEVPRIGDDLRVVNWEEECQSEGDANACGMLALRRLEKGSGPEEWKAGLQGLKNVCGKGYDIACRRYGYAHSYTDDSVMEDNAQVMIRRAAQENFDACKSGDGRSCFMAHFAFQSLDHFLPETFKPLVESADQACEEGDEWACRTLIEYKPDDSRVLSDEQHLSQCKLGFTNSCSLMVDVEAEGMSEVVGEHCGDYPDSPSCRFLAMKSSGEAASSLHRNYCNEGGLNSCGAAAEGLPAEMEHRSVVVAVYDAMQDASSAPAGVAHDVGFWGVELPEIEGLEEACEAGVAEACFGLGLQLSEPGRGEFVPPFDEEIAADYERSFGKACELGMNAGCIALAERFRNRPIDEEVDIERANAALATACERGNRRACWLVDVDASLLERDFDAYEEMLVQACRAEWGVAKRSGPCRELAFFWTFKEGRTPWLLSEKLANALVMPVCRGGDKWSCSWIGWFRPRPEDKPLGTTAPPWHVEDYSAFERSCKKKNLWSCSSLFDLVNDGHPGVSKKEAAELKGRICAVLPNVDGCGEP